MIKYLMLLLIAVQIAVPASMIQKYESVLEKGTVHKFKVVPFDPADPFKGRYVRLNFAISGWSEKYESKDTFNKKDTGYITLKVNNDGYSVVDKLQKKQPKDQAYIKVQTLKGYGKNSAQKYIIILPFNRYYATEDKAPKIEAHVFRRNEANTETKSSVDVRLLKGFGVIEELYINGKKVQDYFQ